jgi:protein-tyrosine phosphatase
MIDIHSHILPGVDDGSPSMEVSLEMLRLAAANGTTDIVATPHANSHFPHDDANIRFLFRQLSENAAGVINLHLGCDFHLNFDNLNDALENPAKYTINGNGYLMVELPDLTSLPAMRNVLRRLLDTRIIPVITHPERNPSVQGQIRDVETWVRDGCLVQITAQSLTGRFGTRAQRFSEALLQQDLVHFVASDAHDTTDRPPNLLPAFKLVARRWGKDRAETLFINNPASALVGGTIYSLPKPGKSGLFSFFRR